MKTIDIELGGLQLKLAPVPLVTLAQLQDDGVEVSSITLNTSQGLNAFAKALGASLRRANPDVTDDFVLNNIDATNGTDLVEKFAQVNGLRNATAGEGESPNQTAA